MQPMYSNLCLATCPRGFTASSGTCTEDVLRYLILKLNAVAPTFTEEIPTDYSVLSGETANNPPAFEPSDPLPSAKRGYYFKGSQYLHLPPHSGTTGTPMVFSSASSLWAWMRIESSGDYAIYSKQIGDKHVFTVSVTSSNQIMFSGGTPPIAITFLSTIPLQTWAFIALRFVYTSSTGQTSVDFRFNGVINTNVYSGPFCIKDSSLTATQMIGGMHSGTSISNMFIGFIWEVALGIDGGSLLSFNSDGCPLNESFCLSSCSFNQEPSSCSACQATCQYGCQRTTDCGLCMDILCVICSSNISNTCTTCVAHATYINQCTCDTRYFVNIATRTCDLCPSKCTECSALDSCFACVPLASLSNGVCACTQGTDSITGSCIMCDLSCQSCSGVSSNQCTVCYPYSGLVAAAPSACVCSPGFFGSPYSCQPCHQTCGTCSLGSAANQCEGCKANASLSGPSPSSCICMDHYFFDPAVSACALCHASCKACNGAGNSECASCLLGAELAGVLQSSCICSVRYFTATDASNCQVCSPICVKCSTAADQCSECTSQAHFVSANPGPCVCDSGFYLTSSRCAACDDSCVACSGSEPNACTVCGPHSQLRNRSCICDSGFYRLGKGCIACSGQCLECVSSSNLGCSSCGANAVLTGSAPNSCQCVSGFRRETQNGPCVKRGNYFAPSDLKAYIDFSFMKLIVTFPLAVASSLAQSCVLIFDPASLARLGDSPMCLWASDNKSLNVQLGANYLLRTETITLIATNIGSVEGDYTTVQQVLALKVTYESPRSPPTAVISAPSAYSPPCESVLRLSGSRSTGLTGQTGLYKWKLTLMPSQQEIDMYKSYSAANVDVSLPSSLLSGDSLNATLFVFDPFNTEGSTSLVVVLTRDTALIVSIDAVSPLQTVRTRPVKIESSCRFTCPVPDIQFGYQWEQLSGTTVDFNPLSSYLYIKPGKLIPSKTYQFRLNAIGGDIRGSVNITIQVSPSPLKVVLNRGDGQHEAGSDLVINATNSIDPDDPLSQLTYQWVCSEGTATCKDKDGNDLVLNSNGTLVVTSDKLRVTAKYQFTLTVSVGARNKTAKIAIEIVSPVSIDIKLSAEQVRYPSGSDQIVSPKIKSTETVTFLWTQISGLKVAISTPYNVPWMKIPGAQVTSGMSFIFALTVTMKSGSLMQQLTSSANFSPAFGRVTVNQTIGETFVDYFWFQAPGWDEPDGTDYPLTYQYGIVPSGEIPRYLTSAKFSFDFISYFYPGLLTFIVKVCDTLEGCTLANIQITVTPPKQRQLQTASLAVSKKKFATEVKTISNIPIAIMNYAKLLTTSVDAELYGMMFNASKTFVGSMPYINNAYFANQLTCCAYMLNLTHLMNSTLIKNMSDFVTGSIAMMVEKLNNDNLNTVLGLYTNLKAKSELTSEIKRFYGIMYAYLSLLPGDIPTTVTSSNMNVTATSTIVTDSKSLNIIANEVGLQFPSTFLTDMKVASGTKCDIRVEVYNNKGEPSPIITVSLARSGLFDGKNLQQNQPQSLNPTGLNSPVNLTVPVNKIIPGIPYTAIAQAENSVKWSTAGVNLAMIAYASAIISAYHFSSFKIVPREMIPIEYVEWPELAGKPEIICEETYTPIIFADLQVVFLILSFAAAKLYRKKLPQANEVPPKSCDAKSENDSLTLPKNIYQIEASRNPGTRITPLWPIEFNLIFGFFSSYRSVVRLLMAIAVFQCENITLGVANKIRFADWDIDIDPEIGSWGGFDFLCCVCALVIGQIYGWILLIAFFQARIRSTSFMRAFTVIVIVMSIMMNSALMWMSTTGCDGVLNRWTAEAIAVMILELVIVSWLSTVISKYAIYVLRQPKIIS